MNIFDEYLIGNTGNIKWGFANTHFNQRLLDNGISLDYVKKTVMYEDPLRYEHESNNSYAVFFPAPSSKDYKEIKLIFSCHDNSIDIVTLIPITKKFNSPEYKKLDKMKSKAYAKRNRKK